MQVCMVSSMQICLEIVKKVFMLCLMIIDPLEFEAAVKEAGLSIAAVCRQAERDPSVFVRWKAATVSPTLRTVQALNDALESLSGSNADAA